jgi:hypothetical protein
VTSARRPRRKPPSRLARSSSLVVSIVTPAPSSKGALTGPWSRPPNVSALWWSLGTVPPRPSLLRRHHSSIA